ncbi:MAG TPA: tRNA uridine-5-carboxymethylaminomethyl(34) synthesis GTPase MnmE [Mariprofundaceae bacterium]|nr:tRNA uridine-5-carboxymethylaminomethyl(34) synthesis GTPase MnmE [Mariprofundaceae bacterium]
MTIAAIATPAGRGGVGVIRISGEHAVSIAEKLSNRPIANPREAQLCQWFDVDGSLIDSGITLYFKAPHSYTGEDVTEIQAHGSPVLLHTLLQRIFDLGARAAEPGEFTRRAVENGKMDLSQAEAVIACIDASTLRAAKLAQRHLHGEFGARVQSLMHDLTGVVAHVEACLDFPEEEIPTLLFDQIREELTQQVVKPIRLWLDTAPLGERLFDGAAVAIIGAPNVGKSSLLNQLAGRDRAIVSDIPGTTRDVLEIDFEVEGIPVRLVDTAGLRKSEDMIEQEGIRRAEMAADDADVVLFVADASRPETWHIDHHVDIKLMNKTDLTEEEYTEDFFPLSIKHGVGMDAVMERLAELLSVVDAGEESLMVTRSRHRQALEVALAHVEKGLEMLGSEAYLDLVALEWRRGWSSLGEILGIGDVEFILDRVFSEFCVGK